MDDPDERTLDGDAFCQYVLSLGRDEKSRRDREAVELKRQLDYDARGKCRTVVSCVAVALASAVARLCRLCRRRRPALTRLPTPQLPRRSAPRSGSA